MEVVRPSLGTVRCVIDPATFFVDRCYAYDGAVINGELPNKGTAEVVEIDLVPPVTFGYPQEAAVVGEGSEVRRIRGDEPWIKERLVGLGARNKMRST